MTRTHSAPPHDHRHLLGIGATKFLNDFVDYLIRLTGLAPGTRKSCCFWVTMSWHFSRPSDRARIMRTRSSLPLIFFLGIRTPAAHDRELRITRVMRREA
jgi:hypothetical protein